MITKEKLNFFQRVMSEVGAIPFAGAFTKGFAKTAIAVERISLVSKSIGQVNTVYTIGRSTTSILGTLNECKKKLLLHLEKQKMTFVME